MKLLKSAVLFISLIVSASACGDGGRKGARRKKGGSRAKIQFSILFNFSIAGLRD